MRRFRRAAKANGWTEEKQLAILPALFQGGTSWVADELEENPPESVTVAATRIGTLLRPKEQRRVLLHRFHEARLKEGEDPREFVMHIRSLLKGGMPELSKEAQDTLILEQIPRVVPAHWTMKLLEADNETVEGIIRKMERLRIWRG